MQVRTIQRSMSILLIAGLALWSCKKAVPSRAETSTDFNNKTTVQYYVAVVGAAATSNNIYADARLVNGTALSYASVFPGTGVGSAIDPGVRDMLLTGGSTQPALSYAQNLQQGRNYTTFFYDSVISPQQKTVETPIVIPPAGTARIRFANFIYNGGPTLPTGIDIFSVKKNAVIFSNVLQTQVTDFINHPAGVTDTFIVRLNGSTANLQNYDTLGKPWLSNVQAVFTPTSQRSYTLIFRGSFKGINNRGGATSYTVQTNARALSVFANY